MIIEEKKIIKQPQATLENSIIIEKSYMSPCSMLLIPLLLFLIVSAIGLILFLIFEIFKFKGLI